MHEDIVEVLRDFAFVVDNIQGKAQIMMLSGDIFNESADEIDRLRAEVDVWKSLCERTISYQIGSDWQDIRLTYEIALKDYHAQRPT